MRIAKLILAAALLLPAAPGWACELDGIDGGHRFFAFSNMVRGGPAGRPQEEDRSTQDKTDDSEQARKDAGGGRSGGETGSDDQSRDQPAFR